MGAGCCFFLWFLQQVVYIVFGLLRAFDVYNPTGSLLQLQQSVSGWWVRFVGFVRMGWVCLELDDQQ